MDPRKPLTAQELSDKLGGKRSGNGFIARCPAHDDKTPSLSISEGEDGKVLLCCHAGCTVGQVLKKMGLTLADITPRKAAHKTKSSNGTVVATYDYRNSKDELSYQVLRWEPKGFKQRRPDGKGGWIWKMKGVQPLPYRLPDVLKAKQNGQKIWIVEGEKDADHLWEIGITATTNHGGAGKWNGDHSQWVKDCDVVIVPDNDPAGVTHAKNIAAALAKISNKNIRVLELSDLPEKGDVSDWLAKGGTAEQLRELAKNAPLAKDWLLRKSQASGIDKDTISDPEITDDESRSSGMPNQPDVADLADAFAKHYSDTFAYDKAIPAWLYWTGTHWKRLDPVKDTELQDGVVELIKRYREKVTSVSKIHNVIELSRGLLAREFASRSGIINFANQTLDANTGELRDHRRDDNLTYCLAYEYCPGEYPTIERTLTEIIPDPAGRLVYMVHIGLALMGDTSFHKGVILYGGPGSGKTTGLRLGLAICGHPDRGFAGAMLFNPELEGMRSRQTWRDRRLVCLDELPKDAIRGAGEDIAKSLLAHSGATMRQMWDSEQTDNVWYPKLMMTTNNAPELVDRSGALLSRFEIVSCPNGRADTEQDHELFDKLMPELGAFAAACLREAAHAKRARAYPTSSEMKRLIGELAIEGDPVKAWANDRVIFSPDACEATDDLFQDFNPYLDLNGFDRSRRMSKPQLTRALLDGWPKQLSRVTIRVKSRDGKLRQVRGIRGLKLKKEADTDVTDGTQWYAPTELSVA